MKTKIVLLCVTAMLIIAGACSGENEVPISVSNNNTETIGDTIKNNKMNIRIGDKILTVTLVDNSSVNALKKALAKKAITVHMSDYGNMEKVGPLGQNFPRNDESITTEAGDVILYQGNALVIYYAPNSWSFTRLGKIDNIGKENLKAILGDGDVTVTLSLPQD